MQLLKVLSLKKKDFSWWVVIVKEGRDKGKKVGLGFFPFYRKRMWRSVLNS